jgi:hypothetical protein
MNGIFYIILGILIIYMVFVIFQAIGGKIGGGQIEALGLCLGPSIFQFKVGQIALRLNWLPLGSYVKFSDDFKFLHPVRKIFILFTGLFAYLFPAFVGLGFGEAIHQTLTGFGQIIGGVFSPVAVGVPLIESLANVFKEKSFIAGQGILAAKLLAFNLFPVGTLSGGLLVIYLLELFGFKSEKFTERFQMIGLFLTFAVMLVWFASILIVVWRGLTA